MAASDLQRGAAEERLTRPTIFALATGAPPSAIAVIRISGPRAFDVLRELTGGPVPPARHLARRTLRHPGNGDIIDIGLVVAFAGPASVTGDDLVELHLHGGRAVVTAALAALDGCGLTPAAPGAFTRRAFDNGKVDLGQVEALGDLLAAETDGQRRAALARAGGELARQVDRWRATLGEIRADVEAALDFADEDGVGVGLDPAGRRRLTELGVELAAARADATRAASLRDGVTVAIVGSVNAGKSTLLNALARRDAAMVSPLPGTTRDIVEVRLALGGALVMLIDTAGVRATDDALEAEAIRRGEDRAAAAGLVIAVGPSAYPNVIAVETKSDLGPGGAGWRDGTLHLSAATGAGLDLLEAELTARVAALLGASEPPLVAARWQVAALDAACAALAATAQATDGVLVAEELRHVALAVERLLGRVTTDDLLDTVFARFCIGK